MGPDPKILDDIARVAGGAVNILSGLQQQMREEIKARIDEMAARMELVPREDMDRAEARIAALEKRIAALEGKTAKPAAKKPESSKTKTAKAKPEAKKKSGKK